MKWWEKYAHPVAVELNAIALGVEVAHTPSLPWIVVHLFVIGVWGFLSVKAWEEVDE